MKANRWCQPSIQRGTRPSKWRTASAVSDSNQRGVQNATGDRRGGHEGFRSQTVDGRLRFRLRTRRPAFIESADHIASRGNGGVGKEENSREAERVAAIYNKKIQSGVSL